MLNVNLDASKDYDIQDLEDVDFLERALYLLCQERLGASLAHLRITPHIRYDALSPQTEAVIESNQRLDDEKLKNLRRHFKKAMVVVLPFNVSAIHTDP